MKNVDLIKLKVKEILDTKVNLTMNFHKICSVVHKELSFYYSDYVLFYYGRKISEVILEWYDNLILKTIDND